MSATAESRATTDSSKVARLMKSFREGDKDAASELVEMFYPELRRIAAHKMKGERAGHSWQPTVLINELFLELTKVKALRTPDNDAGEKTAFLALASLMMKRLLIHHSRPLSKRAEKVPLESPGEQINLAKSEEGLRQVEDLLRGLEEIDPKLRAVVEMKVFEGLTGEEIAARLNCAPRSVARYWNFARGWLEHQLA